MELSTEQTLAILRYPGSIAYRVEGKFYIIMLTKMPSEDLLTYLSDIFQFTPFYVEVPPFGSGRCDIWVAKYDGKIFRGWSHSGVQTKVGVYLKTLSALPEGQKVHLYIEGHEGEPLTGFY